MVSKITKTILAASIALISFNAHATLTSYNANGVDLVYSSVSDVTWTKDANLLGTMIADLGYDTIINAIIDNTPRLTAGNFNLPLTSSHFNQSGQTSWFGAIAFANYLNKISYGGINDWYIPTVVDLSGGFNPNTNGTVKGEELAEMFYSELGGTAWNAIPNTTAFDNVQAYNYWTGTTYSDPSLFYAWVFLNNIGYQSTSILTNLFSVRAVSAGQITAVPEPENLAMLLAGLGLLGVAVRRNKQA